MVNFMNINNKKAKLILKNKSVVFGLIFLGFITVISIFGPLVMTKERSNKYIYSK